MGKNALVILDMLNDFVDGTLANSAAKPIIDPIAELVQKARAHKDWVVVYANDAHLDGDIEFKVFGEHAVAGTEGAAVVGALEPKAGDIVVPKRFYSAFTQTDLAASVQVHDISRFVITGQHTNCCCRHTSYDAYQLGLDIAVVTDGTCVFAPMVGDAYDQVQSDALSYLQTFYKADVLSADGVF